MKLSWMAGALAALLGGAACGGEGKISVGGCNGEDPTCAPPSGGGSGASPGVAGGGAHDAGGGDAAADAQDASSGRDAGVTVDASSAPPPSGSGSGGGGGGTCIPGNACGGLWECSDECYGDKCCRLTCTCTDANGQSGNLQCTLDCP